MVSGVPPARRSLKDALATGRRLQNVLPTRQCVGQLYLEEVHPAFPFPHPVKCLPPPSGVFHWGTGGGRSAHLPAAYPLSCCFGGGDGGSDDAGANLGAGVEALPLPHVCTDRSGVLFPSPQVWMTDTSFRRTFRSALAN